MNIYVADGEGDEFWIVAESYAKAEEMYEKAFKDSPESIKIISLPNRVLVQED